MNNDNGDDDGAPNGAYGEAARQTCGLTGFHATLRACHGAGDAHRHRHCAVLLSQQGEQAAQQAPQGFHQHGHQRMFHHVTPFFGLWAQRPFEAAGWAGCAHPAVGFRACRLLL